MRQTLSGSWALFRLAGRISPGKLALSSVLMVLQSVALPLAAPALAVLTDAAIAGDARRASVAAVLVAVLVVAALTAGHFAHIFYFELGDLAVIQLERDLIGLSHDSPGIEHHERPEYADRLQVLRTELDRSGWGSMQALLSAIGLGVALLITGVLLAQLNPWLLLLPLAALPPLVLGRRAAVVGGGRGARGTCSSCPSTRRPRRSCAPADWRARSARGCGGRGTPRPRSCGRARCAPTPCARPVSWRSRSRTWRRRSWSCATR